MVFSGGGGEGGSDASLHVARSLFVSPPIGRRVSPKTGVACRLGGITTLFSAGLIVTFGGSHVQTGVLLRLPGLHRSSCPWWTRYAGCHGRAGGSGAVRVIFFSRPAIPKGREARYRRLDCRAGRNLIRRRLIVGRTVARSVTLDPLFAGRSTSGQPMRRPSVSPKGGDARGVHWLVTCMGATTRGGGGGLGSNVLVRVPSIGATTVTHGGPSAGGLLALVLRRRVLAICITTKRGRGDC